MPRKMLFYCGLVMSLLTVGHLTLSTHAAPSVVRLVDKQERLEQIDSLAARLNLLLSDFADLIDDLGRLHHLSSLSASEVPRYSSGTSKRNTFDNLAVGGRFG